MTDGIVITEVLETRMFLSATPSAVNPAVQADQAQIHADLLQFKSDILAASNTLHADIAAIKADDPKAATTLKPLMQKLNADLTSMRSMLQADRLDQSAKALADQQVIVADLKKVLADKGNKTAVAADRKQLRTDRIKLQQDMLAGLNARLTTRQSAYTTIFADCQAIVDAIQKDAGASQQLVTDVQKWTADKTASLTTMTTDISKLIADRTQLVADLTALQSA
jgi:hypothetical protein